MSNLQPTSGMADTDTGAPRRLGTMTQALAGPRRLAGLALAAALLLALGFATGRATDRLWPASRASGAPTASQSLADDDAVRLRLEAGAPATAGQTLAADGYAPNALDYREDHRLDAPAGPALAADGYTPTRLDYREDHRADPRPATLPDTPRQQQRLAWLDAYDNGPAAGGAPPPQDDGHNQGPR